MTALFYHFFNNRLPLSIFIEKLKILPDYQIERINSFRNWQDAHASLLGKLLLIEGLKAFNLYLPITDLAVSPYGKPYIKGSPVNFNISHSGRCVACVISSETAIGLDVEEKKDVNINDFESVWNPIEWIDICNGDLNVFYNYWTRKEAIAKADGRGLSIPLNEIHVEGEFGFYEQKAYYFNQPDLSCAYSINIASSSITDIEVVAISENRLLEQ